MVCVSQNVLLRFHGVCVTKRVLDVINLSRSRRPRFGVFSTRPYLCPLMYSSEQRAQYRRADHDAYSPRYFSLASSPPSWSGLAHKEKHSGGGSCTRITCEAAVPLHRATARNWRVCLWSALSA